VRADAVLVGSALARGAAHAAEGVDVTAAWRRLSTAVPAPEPARPARQARQVPPRRKRSFEFLRRPAVAAVAVGLVLTGAGTAAANDWLQIFRTEKLAPVTLTSADLLSLPDLSDYGTISAGRDPERAPRSPTLRPPRRRAGSTCRRSRALPAGSRRAGLPGGAQGDGHLHVLRRTAPPGTAAEAASGSRSPRRARRCPCSPRGRARASRRSGPAGWRACAARGSLGRSEASPRRPVRDRTRLPALASRAARGRGHAAPLVHRGRLRLPLPVNADELTSRSRT
jgi:hypothetical protein